MLQENYHLLHVPVGLTERKPQVSHFPWCYQVGTTRPGQLSVDHKSSNTEVHHRSSCLLLWSASPCQCGHRTTETLQLGGTSQGGLPL